MARKVIVYSETEGVGKLTLSDPPRNEFSGTFWAELSEIVTQLKAKRSLRGLIVTGSGNHFSSGANVDELLGIMRKTDFEAAAPFFTKNMETFRSLESLPFPTIAAIKGCCLGAGLELALACTYRIAAPRALLGLPESSFGIIPGCGGSIRLTQLIGIKNALELLISGSTLLAEDALKLQLIDRIVPKKELLPEAVILIGKDRNITFAQ